MPQHDRPPNEPSAATNGLFVLGLCVFLAASELLGAQAAGFFDFFEIKTVPLPLLGVIAAVGGAVGASLVCLNGPSRGTPAAVAGAIGALGIFLATYYYLQARPSFFRVEIVIPFVVGGLPGYYLLGLLTHSRNGHKA